MKAALPRLDPRGLQSRVARRVFSLFVACALLPVAAFAFFAYRQVVDELEREAVERLHRESKNAGMSIVERLLLLDGGMEMVLAGLDDASPRSLARADEALRMVSRGATTNLRRFQPGLDALSERHRAHLEAGMAALVSVPRRAAPARLMLVRSLTLGGETVLLAADLAAAYVFAPDGRDLSDHYWVEDAEGRRIFAAEHTGWKPRAAVRPEPGSSRRVLQWEGDGEPLLGSSWTIFLASRFASAEWLVAHARPVAEIHRPLNEFKATFPLVVGLSMLGVTWISLVQIRRRLVPIATLVEGTRRFASRRFESVEIDTNDEFRDLAAAFNEMGEEIRRRLDVLATVNAIGASLSAEESIERLLQLVVRGSVSVTGAHGGALFLRGEGAALEPAALMLGGGALPLAPGGLPGAATARRCADEGLVRQVRGGAERERLDPGEWREVEERFGFEVGSAVGVPLRSERGDAIGALLLFRTVDRGERPLAFDEESCELAWSLASQAAVALTKTRLVDSFRSLFEGLIQLTVRAIDEKSPHTGEHCRKVPILTEMIQRAACAESIGPLKDFDLTPEERYELRIAALLHDCGKVVTPVHVMDKATKLETIFDRIELVQLRFEIVRRDAQLRALATAFARGGGDPDRVLSEPELLELLAAMDGDLALLRRCNRGNEFTPEEVRQAVARLAEKYRWRDVEGVEQPLLTADELENLSIVRGTLNQAEREIIQYHAVATIKLLEELPFPEHMRNVPTIAGSHHERMDGRGYPNRLRGSEISMQGRILGLADVFEALTAKDRPYKPGRTLSECLEILDRMQAEGHIDPDLYDVFVRERIYLRYAIDYLDPEQVDEAHQEDLERLTSGVPG